jgi:hypothetical protein
LAQVREYPEGAAAGDTACVSAFKVSAARPLLCLSLLVAAYLIVGYATLTPGHVWGDDWAQYLAHASNLAVGHPYADTGYVFNPAQPHVGPPAYSPGLPLLLAPVVKFAGLDLFALKLTSLAALALASVLTFVLYEDSFGAWVALGAAAFFSLHDSVWFLHNGLHSEPSYIVWTLAALICLARPVRGQGVLAGLAFGLFAYAAFVTRPIGAALLLAAALYEILQRRFVTWRFVCIVGIPAIGYVLQKHFLAVADYSNELRVLTPKMLTGDALEYWKQASTLFPIMGPLSLLSPLVVLSLTTLGVFYRIRTNLEGHPSYGLATRGAALLRATPVDLWYLLIYCGTLVVLPFVQEARYLVPTLPIVCAYSVYGLSRSLAGRGYARPAIASICAVALSYYAVLHWKHDRTPVGDDALCDDCRLMYDYLHSQTPQGTTVAFAKPRALALLSGRRGWMWSTTLDQQANWQSMASAHVSYVVLVAPDSPLARLYPAYFAWDGWRSNPQLNLVYENPTFRVLRVQSAGS